MHSALLNLAINARDAMPDGGEIRFTSRFEEMDRARCDAEGIDVTPGRYVVLSVTDTGKGVSKEARRHLFEPFFTTKPTGEGTGMGLAAVYGTAKLHKGTVTVRSEVGRGAEFSLYLPLSEEELARPRVRTPVSIPAEKGLGIMVVDDEAVVRRTMTMLIETLGHTVVACEDGETAVATYRTSWRELDVVVLDMMMPGLSGRQTFLALKEINPDVRVLLISGYSVDDEAKAALDAGARDFIQKPVKMEDMASRLGEVSGRYKKNA